MLHLKAILTLAAAALVLAVVCPAAPSTADAAVLESAKIENWTLNAYSSDKTGRFHVCSMKSSSNDQVSLTVSANPHNRWYLWLYRAEWDFDVDSRFVVALTLDSDRKNPIALDAEVTNDRFVKLYLPTDRRVLDLFLRADTAHVSAEGQTYTFPLGGYAKAVAWMKDCVRRNNALDAVKAPDATIRGADDDDTDAGGIQTRKAKPEDTPKLVPKAVPKPLEPKPSIESIEASAQQPAAPAASLTRSPIVNALATLFAPAQPPASSPAPSAPPQVAAVAPAQQTAPLSDAARATLTPTEPAATSASPKPAELLLPKLMAAANRADFKLLDPTAAPAAMKRADVIFSLATMTGTVMAFDLPTPEAATNDVIAYDRVACEGAYSAIIDPPDDGQPKVLRASSECQSGNAKVATHYLTLPRKSGGYFVVSLTSAGPQTGDVNAPMMLADQALFDAAIKVSGQF